jgi:hypothetical protein
VREHDDFRMASGGGFDALGSGVSAAVIHEEDFEGPIQLAQGVRPRWGCAFD